MRISRRDLLAASGLHGFPGRFEARLQATPESEPSAALSTIPFFYGREYFILRSGRCQMLLQADRADLGPAMTYLLFDSAHPDESAQKSGARNFVPVRGFSHTCLTVVLGGHPFTALGHTTDTRWTISGQGVPAVEAAWWAGGIHVVEQFTACPDLGVFLRAVRLESANLAAEEQVYLRLELPPGARAASSGLLFEPNDPVRETRLALAAPDAPWRITAENVLEVGPLAVVPGSSIGVNTILAADLDPTTSPDAAARVAAFSASSARAGAAGYWKTKSSLRTADRTVEELFNKARFGLDGLVSPDGFMNASLLEYGRQWVRDSSNTALGAIHAGHFEMAHAVLERILTTMLRDEGLTMVNGAFEQPENEQPDQMGELLHALKAYRDWTGDDRLIQSHRGKLIPLIERPLLPMFRDGTGLFHNRREFWERRLDDGYELAYQTWIAQGLLDAADLAKPLAAEWSADRWRAIAAGILKSVQAHPTHSLVHEGRLTKRRNLNGEVAENIKFDRTYQRPDSPAATETVTRVVPDATMALPFAMRLLDPRSEVARRTLDALEALWNARWSCGGYERYHSSSQLDQPGPWTFATTFLLRAQHEAGLYDRSRRSLEWLNTVQGGRAGLWFEQIPITRSQERACGLIPWTSGEVALFCIRHLLGVRFEEDRLVIHPALYPGSPSVSADLRFRQGRLRIDITGSGRPQRAELNGKAVRLQQDGALALPPDFAGGDVVIHAG